MLLDGARIFGLCGAGLVGIGLFVVVVRRGLVRRILGFNLLGAGLFLVFGAAARRGAAAGFAGDPVPQALVITGIVVAFCASALAVALLSRLGELRPGARLDLDAGDAPEPRP